MLDARGVETIDPREVNLTPPSGVWHSRTTDFREIGSHNLRYQTLASRRGRDREGAEHAANRIAHGREAHMAEAPSREALLR